MRRGSVDSTVKFGSFAINGKLTVTRTALPATPQLGGCWHGLPRAGPRTDRPIDASAANAFAPPTRTRDQWWRFAASSICGA